MSSRKPLVLNNGQIEQLQFGDTLDAFGIQLDLVLAGNANTGSIVKGQPVYVASGGSINLANAATAGKQRVFGLVYDTSILSGASGSIITDGELEQSDWTAVIGSTFLVPQSVYYLDTIEGRLSNTPPVTGYVVEVGQALSATSFEITQRQPIKL